MKMGKIGNTLFGIGVGIGFYFGAVYCIDTYFSEKEKGGNIYSAIGKVESDIDGTKEFIVDEAENVSEAYNLLEDIIDDYRRYRIRMEDKDIRGGHDE